MLSESGCARSQTSAVGSTTDGWRSWCSVSARACNQKKVNRRDRLGRLTVRKRGGRKHALGKQAPMAIPHEPNQRWSLNFVSDALACGRRFRVLNVIDDCSRVCVGCILGTSLSGPRVVCELSPTAERRGVLCMLVSDNGTELTGHTWPCLMPGYRGQMALYRAGQTAAERLCRKL